MKLQIIETPDYVLAISDEEIKEGDYRCNIQRGYLKKIEEDPTYFNKRNDVYKKIIAYQPKNNAPELLPFVKYGNMTFKELNGDGSYYECIDCGDWEKILSGKFLKAQSIELYKNKYELALPLLPEMVGKDDIEKLAEQHIKDYEIYFDTKKEALHTKMGFISGYITATKIYSEDDLRKAYEDGFHSATTDSPVKDFSLYFNQEFKQPKTPKWFVAETEELTNQQKEQYSFMREFKLKTTTINGKTYLVGTYQ
jgi:hypothetical protein